LVVKRDIQVGADKDTLVFGTPLGAEVGKADDVHGLVSLLW
jgi:hypothetical protein